MLLYEEFLALKEGKAMEGVSEEPDVMEFAGADCASQDGCSSSGWGDKAARAALQGQVLCCAELF